MVDTGAWVKQNGYPNVFGAMVEVPSNWKLDVLAEELQGYDDREIVEYLKYGWPANRLPSVPYPSVNHVNHASARDFPDSVSEHIKKMRRNKWIIGPFAEIPFPGRVAISPLSTRSKKDSDERRLILDLSYPDGMSVNDWTPKDNYLGFKVKLEYPKVDDLARRLVEMGTGALMFKRDLHKYFHQIPLDPADVELFGFQWCGGLYWFTVLVMGHRIAPYIAQRVSNAIAFIHRKQWGNLFNYVDDFLGVEVGVDAWRAFYNLEQVFSSVGLTESKDKAAPPTPILDFLGVLFNVLTGTMEITPQRLLEIREITYSWLNRRTCRRVDLERLIGKVQFVASCVRPGRVFIARMLNELRQMNRLEETPLSHELKKDIYWWNKFMPLYNGVSLMWLEQHPEPNEVFATDASRLGLGGILWDKEYFRMSIPEACRDKNIAHLEMLALIVGLKAWGKLHLSNKYVVVECDNEAVVTIVNSGKSKDMYLQKCLRELVFLLAKNQVELRAKHIRSESNDVADALSRWKYGGIYRQRIRDYCRGKRLIRTRTPSSMLKFNHDW